MSYLLSSSFAAWRFPPRCAQCCLMLKDAACSPLPAEPIVRQGHSELTALQIITFFFKVKKAELH